MKRLTIIALLLSALFAVPCYGQSTRLTSKTTAELSALPIKKTGDIYYNSTTSTVQVWTGAAFVDVLFTSSNLNASNLASGTVPNARFPSTLPAVSGANLTNLNATNLASGTVANARLSESAQFWADKYPIADDVDEFLGSADYSAMRTNLSLVPGTNVQAFDSDLTTWAGVTPGTGVATALGNAINSASGVVALNSSGYLPLGSYFTLSGSGTSGSPNFLNNPDFNSIGTGCAPVWILGGQNGLGNHVGRTARPGNDYALTGWEDDSGYVEGAADHCHIGFGYDNVANAIGSVILGANHCYIKYSSGGHGWITNSTACLNANTYTAIHGCNLVGITGGQTGCGAYSAFESEMSGGQYMLFLGGHDNAMTSANESVIISGNNNTLTASSSTIVNGVQASVSHTQSVMFGEDGRSIAPNSIVMSAPSVRDPGEFQFFDIQQRVITSNASATNLTGNGGAFASSTGVWRGTITVHLTGTRDGSADGNNDSDYTTVHYVAEMGFGWNYNTSTGYICDSSGESTGSAPTRALERLAGNTSNTFSPGADPYLALNTGALRVVATGIAATSIKWSVKVSGSMTRVD